MLSLVLAGLLHLAAPVNPKPAPRENPVYVSIPESNDSMTVAFVAAKGNHIYKLLTPIQFQKILKKCLYVRVDGFDTQQGPLLVFRCEESL